MLSLVVGDALTYSERSLEDRIIFTQLALNDEALSQLTHEERVILALALYGPYIELDSVLSLIWAGGWKVLAGMLATNIALSLQSPAWYEFTRLAGTLTLIDSFKLNVAMVKLQQQLIVNKLSESERSVAETIWKLSCSSGEALVHATLSSISDVMAAWLPYVSPEEAWEADTRYDDGSEPPEEAERKKMSDYDFENIEYSYEDIDISCPIGDDQEAGNPSLLSKVADQITVENAGKVLEAVPFVSPELSLLYAGHKYLTDEPKPPLGNRVKEALEDVPIETTDHLSLDYVEDHDDELIGSRIVIDDYGAGTLYQVKKGDAFIRVIRDHYKEWSRKLGVAVNDHPLNKNVSKTDMYGYDKVLGKKGLLFAKRYDGFNTKSGSGQQFPVIWLPEV
jgi:hypothetical protein